jgi:hypothetical protein
MMRRVLRDAAAPEPPKPTTVSARPLRTPLLKADQLRALAEIVALEQLPRSGREMRSDT